jgi:hypothetical protein
LAQSLKEMLSLPTQGPVYLIVDALDECPNDSGMPTSREEVLDLVQDLVGLYLPNLHICVTSRPEIDIRTTLDPLTTHSISLHDQSGQKKDIADYISSVVYSDKRMRKWREEDRRLVIKTLSERADGMYVCCPPCHDRFSCCHIGSGGCTASWKRYVIVSHQASGESLMTCRQRWMKHTSRY